MSDDGSEFDLAFFKSQGFHRRECPKCKRHFWTLGDWPTCGEPPCEEYTFIHNSPMKKALDVHETREAYLSFFEKHGHGRIRRYPIVARWRDDVFFTQASIYDFQPWVLNGVIDPPANPLTISQTCVRFNDIDNVGKTGRHFTFFEMLAHHAFNKPGHEIYFKDRTVELCHRLFAEAFNVDPHRLRYIEEWWEGGGNSGPCVEVILDGVEVATLVFMQYRETPQGRKKMEMTVVDTGYGLERICWVSQGSPSSYDAVFGPVVEELKQLKGISTDSKVLTEYSKVAGALNMKTAADVRHLRETVAARLGISYEELLAIVAPLEDIYTVCDHTRALMVMLNDGVVPSNVKEGYFARLLVRRAMRSVRNLGLDISLADVVSKQIDYFQKVIPELVANREDIMNLVQVEEARYYETLGRGKQLVGRMIKDLKPGEKMPLDKLIDLYDSHGLNPEIAAEFAPGVIEVPDNFYMQVAQRHEKPETEKAEKEDLPERLPETRMLYYEDATKAEFEATVVAHINGGIALDQSCFYPEGGGQEWDMGTLGGLRVCKVIKAKTCILHFVDGMLPPVGTKMHGHVDMERRLQLMRHHTAAHVINGAARNLFGNHVWQAGAHKSVEEGRLDITHYENLTMQQRDALEKECNRVVLADLPISITFMQRDVAEAKHGYRLYQGGAVPGKVIRVVDIIGFDTEACGGLHCTHTGMIGPIRLRRTKRIQDGIVRVEYTAGMAAIREFQRDKDTVEESAEALNLPMDKVAEGIARLQEEARTARKQLESLGAQMNELKAAALLSSAIRVGEARLVVHIVGDEDPEELSKRLVAEKKVVAVIGKKGASCKVLISRSSDLEVDCRPLLKEVMSFMGGGGGGRKEYAQGGGGSAEKMDAAFAEAEAVVRKAIKP